MQVRQAKENELPRILAIYERARAFMRETGNPTQWGDGYPPKERVVSDIQEGLLFVVEDAMGLQGVFALYPDGDPAYDALNAPWCNDLPYAALHRVASGGERRGVLRACVKYAHSVCQNLKIDTHKENLVMQSALKRLGFTPCGVADIPNVGERILFQRYEKENV